MPVIAQSIKPVESIRINQVGFYPYAQKIAIITSPNVSKFAIINDKNKVIFNGQLVPSKEIALNGKKTLIADFSSFNKSGKYYLTVPGIGTSNPFEIGESVFYNLGKASIKAFYFQRASTALPETFAGKWKREAGHPDDKVLIHPSAASSQRPAGSIISVPKGWYDAGDYNKYIVNSGITMGTILSLCEDFPEHVEKLKTNIPESNNNVPDVLDEAIWNLRWMLAMQDPNDGGVYNKLTNADFDGMVMPEITKDPRYVVQKGTAATLDFSAVTAQASRLLIKYKKTFPGLADSCIQASIKAWNWAKQNPLIAYDQNNNNTRFQPKINTGGYGDRTFSDEFIWAASELYITTGDTAYLNAVNLLPDEKMPLPSWGNVRLQGYYSLIQNEKKLGSITKVTIDTLKKRLITFADNLITGVDQTAYKTVMGKTSRDFGWGSNSTAANQGIALIQAYKISSDKKYLNYALSNLDYILGRNATGYSYVTGIGFKSPMHPHHRPSAADAIPEPVPGLLVGGPNPGKQDGVGLPSIIADEAYIDSENSYAANEIAINWNAPLVYLANALEALQLKAGYSKTLKKPH